MIDMKEKKELEKVIKRMAAQTKRVRKFTQKKILPKKKE